MADAEPGGQWKRVFMAQISLNRKKHDLFYLTANKTQNAVVREVVNNWFNPTSHSRNLRWETERRARKRRRGTLEEGRSDAQPVQNAEPRRRGDEPEKTAHGPEARDLGKRAGAV